MVVLEEEGSIAENLKGIRKQRNKSGKDNSMLLFRSLPQRTRHTIFEIVVCALRHCCQI